MCFIFNEDVHSADTGSDIITHQNIIQPEAVSDVRFFRCLVQITDQCSFVLEVLGTTSVNSASSSYWKCCLFSFV